jgi:hypothetical protein
MNVENVELNSVINVVKAKNQTLDMFQLKIFIKYLVQNHVQDAIIHYIEYRVRELARNNFIIECR